MLVKKLKNVSIAARAWSILGLFAIGLFANTFLNIDKSRQHMSENYERGVETIVESAGSVIDYYNKQMKSGALTTTVA